MCQIHKLLSRGGQRLRELGFESFAAFILNERKVSEVLEDGNKLLIKYFAAHNLSPICRFLFMSTPLVHFNVSTG